MKLISTSKRVQIKIINTFEVNDDVIYKQIILNNNYCDGVLEFNKSKKFKNMHPRIVSSDFDHEREFDGYPYNNSTIDIDNEISDIANNKSKYQLIYVNGSKHLLYDTQLNLLSYKLSIDETRCFIKHKEDQSEEEYIKSLEIIKNCDYVSNFKVIEIWWRNQQFDDQMGCTFDVFIPDKQYRLLYDIIKQKRTTVQSCNHILRSCIAGDTSIYDFYGSNEFMSSGQLSF